MGSERRQHPRIAANPPLQAHIADEGRDLIVHDVSTGGFRAEAHEPIAVDRSYLCDVRTLSGRWLRVSATAVYCRRRPGTAAVFDIGFAFAQTRLENAAMAGALVEHVTAVLEFES